LGLVLLSGACGGESARAPAAAPETRLVDLEQLAAAVKQNLGRGALVNVWATW
jgi:hypothetical protein